MRLWEGHIVFTTEEGGYFRAKWGTKEEYDKAVSTGHLDWSDWDGTSEELSLAFIVWCPLGENHDFILGERFVPNTV